MSFETIEQRVSYGVGRQLGDQLRNNPFKEFDITAVQAGIADALADATSQVSDEDLNAAFSVVSKKLQEQEQASAKEASAEGEKFLADNAKRDEVTVTVNTVVGAVGFLAKEEKEFLKIIDKYLKECIFRNGYQWDDKTQTRPKMERRSSKIQNHRF